MEQVKRQSEKPERATLNLWPDAAALLGIGRNSIYNAAKSGEIPTIRLGKRLLVPKAALDRLLEAQ